MKRANYNGFISAQVKAGYSREDARLNYYALKNAGFRPGRWHGQGSRVEYLRNVAEQRNERRARRGTETELRGGGGGGGGGKVVSSIAQYEAYIDSVDYDDDWIYDEWVSSLDYGGEE